MSERIGFIGLGNMGQPMASNLLKAGFAFLLHDRFMASVAKGRGEMDWSALAMGVSEDAGLSK